MIKLIDTRLVAKLMKETAKECGMTPLYSSTDNIWWAKHYKLKEQGDINPVESYRRIVKAYDFIADNFIELLEAKVKAEGFDLADNEITFSTCPTTDRDWCAEEEKYGESPWKHPSHQTIYKDHKMKGGTYVRMIASFIGERRYKVPRWWENKSNY